MWWSRHNRFHKVIKHIEIQNVREYLETFELKITWSVREPNTRGLIYDCNGGILADNWLIYTVTMVDNGVYASDRERQLTVS